MSRTAIKINLDTAEQTLLEHILRKLSVPEFQKERVQIVLAASTGLQNKAIVAQYGFEENRVGKWRKRWAHAHQQWQDSDTTLRPPLTEALVFQWLADKKGRGRKEYFTSDQLSKIGALCQEHPEQHGFPVTHWSAGRLVQATIKRGIVNTISERTMNRILKKRLLASSKSVLPQCQDR